MHKTIFHEAASSQTDEFTIESIREYVLSHNGWWNDHLGLCMINNMVRENFIQPTRFDEDGKWYFIYINIIDTATKLLENDELLE